MVRSAAQRKAMFANMNNRSVASPFAKANRLPVQVSIIVPSTNFNKKISDSRFKARINAEKKWMDSKYGGDTSVRTVGSYLDTVKGKEVHIKERGAEIAANTTVPIYNKNRKAFAEHVRQRSKDWNQYQMLARVEGQSYLVPYSKDLPDDKNSRKRVRVTE